MRREKQSPFRHPAKEFRIAAGKMGKSARRHRDHAAASPQSAGEGRAVPALRRARKESEPGRKFFADPLAKAERRGRRTPGADDGEQPRTEQRDVPFRVQHRRGIGIFFQRLRIVPGSARDRTDSLPFQFRGRFPEIFAAVRKRGKHIIIYAFPGAFNHDFPKFRKSPDQRRRTARPFQQPALCALIERKTVQPDTGPFFG